MPKEFLTTSSYWSVVVYQGAFLTEYCAIHLQMDKGTSKRKKGDVKEGPRQKKGRPSEAVSSSTVTVTNEASGSHSERLWASMYKGNAAVCNGVFNFNWTCCDEIILHDGTKCGWVTTFNEGISVCFGAKVVKICNVPLNCERSAPFDDRKARVILSTMYSLYSSAVTIVQEQRPDTLAEDAESGDDTIIDEGILPAFPNEWGVINSQFQALRQLFVQAKDSHFDNASGKFFMQDLMKFCCWVDIAKCKYARLGTNSSGEEQPGCAQLTLKTPTYVNERSRSRSTSTQTSTSSTPASTPTPESDNYKSEPHNHYPDQVYWDSIRDLYRIVGEVKSAANQPVQNQHTEQMVGLFRSHQNYMLGYIIKPDTIQIRILEKEEGTLRMHNFDELPLSNASTLELVCKLFIAFIFFVDC